LVWFLVWFDALVFGEQRKKGERKEEGLLFPVPVAVPLAKVVEPLDSGNNRGCEGDWVETGKQLDRLLTQNGHPGGRL